MQQSVILADVVHQAAHEVGREQRRHLSCGQAWQQFGKQLEAKIPASKESAISVYSRSGT
jgi:hypothetical protein